MKLEYTIAYVADDTYTYEVITVGSHKIRTGVHHVFGDVFVKWRVPRNAPGQMKYCVQSFETAPYSGVTRDCTPIYIS